LVVLVTVRLVAYGFAAAWLLNSPPAWIAYLAVLVVAAALSFKNKSAANAPSLQT
jgi:hypothetical protein